MVRDGIIEEFLSDLSSDRPVPGGGGASALSGAFGVSLGAMVARLSVGKKKLKEHEPKFIEAIGTFDKLKEVFLSLADRDEAVFLNLKNALALPKETEEEIRVRDIALMFALIDAAEVPVNIMETSLGALEMMEEIAPIGSKFAISDVAVGASCLYPAMEGASMNVLINANLMKDREKAGYFLERRKRILSAGKEKAERIKNIIAKRLEN